MGWRDRISIFLLFSAALLGLELAHDVYRWFAFEEERAQIRVLGPLVEAAGMDVVRSQLRADSLRKRIEAMDVALETVRLGFDRYDQYRSEGVPTHLYGRYRSEVTEYNRQVAVRQAWVRQWQTALSENRLAVSRYNSLADQIRSTAVRMGEDHYNVPTPVEAAVRNGLSRP